MITAKQAKNGTRIERYIKEKCDEIEESIKLCMDLGLGYCKYSGNLPKSVEDMLIELGYKVTKQDDMFAGTRFIISWGSAKEDDVECN